MVERNLQTTSAPQPPRPRDERPGDLRGEDWPAEARAALREAVKQGPIRDGCEEYDPPNALSMKLLDELIELLREHDLKPSSMGPAEESGASFSFYSDATNRRASIWIDNDGDVDVITMEIFSDRNKVKSWIFPHARREMVQSIEIVIAFLAGEEVPERDWPMNPAWFEED